MPADQVSCQLLLRFESPTETCGKPPSRRHVIQLLGSLAAPVERAVSASPSRMNLFLSMLSMPRPTIK